MLPLSEEAGDDARSQLNTASAISHMHSSATGTGTGTQTGTGTKTKTSAGRTTSSSSPTASLPAHPLPTHQHNSNVATCARDPIHVTLHIDISRASNTHQDRPSQESTDPVDFSQANAGARQLQHTGITPHPPPESTLRVGQPYCAPSPDAFGKMFDPRMYGRDRNPRRGATKTTHELPTPAPIRPRSIVKEFQTPTHTPPATPRELQSSSTKRKRQSSESARDLTKRQLSRGTVPRRAGERGSESPHSVTESNIELPARNNPPEGATEFIPTGPVTEDASADRLIPGGAPCGPAEHAPATVYLSSTTTDNEQRPIRDVEGDRRYVAEAIQAMAATMKKRANSTHKVASSRISQILSLAQYPSETEAGFLSTQEAEAALRAGHFFNAPIITHNQQSLPLQSVEQFLDEFYNDKATVYIQDSSASAAKSVSAVRPVEISKIKARFASERDEYPWNCLELATHHDDGLRPQFLQSEETRLITKLKIPDSFDEARRRTYDVGFKEIEKWALLAEAGALTEPHQDSHGYSTYITVNTGRMGFGWLSHPTRDERAEWVRAPQRFASGRWRYVVLKPGQTVYFPAGTVHMVFRLPAAGNTLAFGGHVLRCSNIVHWVRTLLEEHSNPNITNEDLTDSATGYLERVERFVLQARKNGDQAKWGGEDSIAEFLTLKEEFCGKKKPVSKRG